MIESQIVECLLCGAKETFKPGQFETTCGGCENDLPLPVRIDSGIAVHALDGSVLMSPVARGRVRVCERCGAVCSGPSEVVRCPGCGAATRRPQAVPQCVEADGILPFRLSEVEAGRSLSNELRRLGSELTGLVQLRAVYIPWWVLGWHHCADYVGEQGTVETRHNQTTGSTSRTIWCDWSGRIERPWPHVERCASSMLPQDVASRLAPWDWAFAEPYKIATYTDALCEHMNRDPAAVMDALVDEAEDEIRDAICADIGGDRQRIISIEHAPSARCYRVFLMPVWIGRLATGAVVAVNGRTAEVVLEGFAAEQPDENDAFEPGASGRTRSLVIGVVAVGLVALAASLWMP